MQIFIRELKETDAPYMLEWMHDQDIQKCFQKNMMSKSIEDVCKFCISSKIPVHPKQFDNLHFAITDDSDEYLGTISLKNIDFINSCAEYAISLRKKAQGKGIAYKATEMILQKAFYEYDLHRVYLNVLSDNTNAIKLYEKIGFDFEGEFRDHLLVNGEYKNLKWYGLLENDFKCKILNTVG